VLIDKPRIPFRHILLHGWWPGFLKILFYRAKGYRIGKGVSIGFGTVICGKQVEVGEHTSIGFLTIIRGEQIRLGSHVQIGAMTFLDTPHMEIGEGTKINEQVFVGGLQAPDSRFIVGRNCQIMQLSFINPARSVVIGDDSGIGGHCLIFGHSSWLNQFEGYAVDFGPIEIGSSVGLAWRTFVLPGARIGDGTMVGANSVVSGTLPENSMAVGFPARVVAGPPAFPKKLMHEEKVEMFRRIVAEMIDYFGGWGLDCRQDGECYVVRQSTNGWRIRRAKGWRMQVTDGDVREAAKRVAGVKPDVFLSLCEIPRDVREVLSAQKIMWIDIAKKEQPRSSNDLGDEVLNFFKRYGVRTLRCPTLSPAAGVAVKADQFPYTSAN